MEVPNDNEWMGGSRVCLVTSSKISKCSDRAENRYRGWIRCVDDG